MLVNDTDDMANDRAWIQQRPLPFISPSLPLTTLALLTPFQNKKNKLHFKLAKSTYRRVMENMMLLNKVENCDCKS